jgi:hypothetical protein
VNISAQRRLALLVVGTAAAVLLTEIILTRLFSVLLFYHFSFLAVALALFGLAGGGLLAARRPLGPDQTLFERTIRLRLLSAAAALASFAIILATIPPNKNDLLVALALSLLSAVPLVLLGEVLARSLARGRAEIHRLYAFDLVASSAAALAAIPLLQWVQGPAVLFVPAAGTLRCC